MPLKREHARDAVLFTVLFAASEYPPRPPPNSHYSLSLAGYWPARGEFAVVRRYVLTCSASLYFLISTHHFVQATNFQLGYILK